MKMLLAFCAASVIAMSLAGLAFARVTRDGADSDVTLHSAVDYPLRTPALMSVGGLLMGVAVARRSRSNAPSRANGRGDLDRVKQA